MLQDFRFAFRQLAKSPGFAAVAVVTLALAMAVNSAIFAFVHGVIFKPPVSLRPAEVVNVFTVRKSAQHDYRPFSFNEWRALRQNHDVFSEVAAMQYGYVGTGHQDDLRRSFTAFVSENYFSLFGAQPALGHFFSAQECAPNADMPVVMTSYSFWKRRGGRADFVGSELRVNGRPYTVIGVAAKGFTGLNAIYGPELWLPLGVYSQLGRGFGATNLEAPDNYTLALVARLHPGLTIDSAKSRLPLLAQRLAATQPLDPAGARELQIQAPPRLGLSPNEPVKEGSDQLSVMGILLMAMAAVVLLIACLNLANMLFAGAPHGQRRLQFASRSARLAGESYGSCSAKVSSSRSRGESPGFS